MQFSSIQNNPRIYIYKTKTIIKQINIIEDRIKFQSIFKFKYRFNLYFN